MSIACSPDRPGWIEQPIEQHVAGRELVRFLSGRVNEITARWQWALQERHRTRAQNVFPKDDLRGHMPLVVWWIIRSISEDDAPCPSCADTLRRVAHHWREAGYEVEETLLHLRVLSRLLHDELRTALAALKIPVNLNVGARISERLSHGIMLAQVVVVAAYRDEEEARFSAFTSMLAHEIRSPLGAALAALQTLDFLDDRNDPEEPKLRKTSMERVEQALWDVNAIVGAVQSLTRAQAATSAGQKRELLSGIIDQVLADLSSEGRAVDVAREGNIPAVLMPAAPVMLTLQNLVRNAIAYADPAKPARWVRIGCERDDDGERWLLRVHDNGIGIPREEQKSVFERFRRGRNAPGEGYGLGLSIVLAAARCMGGDVAVESEPGQGTTFTLVVPFHQTQSVLQNE
jgi:signal transduction histidine kinase